MATVKAHYENHLASIYEWMQGDFDAVCEQRFASYRRLGLGTHHHLKAIDLGAGHGVDSFALQRLGYEVVAIDFDKHLLDSLAQRDQNKQIHIVESELTRFHELIHEASLIACMGDTLAHLESFEALGQLFRNCHKVLTPEGKLLLSYRDYSVELHDSRRFIPVKADDSRILTCFLEFGETTVNVTDILHERQDGQWSQKVSSYVKLRITIPIIEKMLRDAGFELVHREETNRMVYTLVEKVQ